MLPVKGIYSAYNDFGDGWTTEHTKCLNSTKDSEPTCVILKLKVLSDILLAIDPADLCTLVLQDLSTSSTQ